LTTFNLDCAAHLAVGLSRQKWISWTRHVAGIVSFGGRVILVGVWEGCPLASHLGGIWLGSDF